MASSAEWTTEEDCKLRQLVEEDGEPEDTAEHEYRASISSGMPNRTNHEVFNRWQEIRASKVVDAAPAPMCAPVPAEPVLETAGNGPVGTECSKEKTDAKLGAGAYAEGWRILISPMNNYYGKRPGDQKWFKTSIKELKQRKDAVHPLGAPRSTPAAQPLRELLVFIGDSNAYALSTGGHTKKEETVDWCTNFGSKGLIPAINGGVNGAVYGSKQSEDDLRCYLRPHSPRSPPDSSRFPKFTGFVKALDAMQCKPRGLVYDGWANHIGLDSTGGPRLRDSISKDCDILIEDVRDRFGMLFPIYLVELYLPKKGNAMKAVNYALELSAKKHENVYVVKLASYLTGDHASGEDALHLTPAGYVEIQKAIVTTVLTVEQRKLPDCASPAAAATGPAAAVATDFPTKERRSREKLERIQKEITEKKEAHKLLHAPSIEEVAEIEERERVIEERKREIEERKREIEKSKREVEQELAAAKNKRKQCDELEAELTSLTSKKQLTETAVEAFRKADLAIAAEAAAAEARAEAADVED